MSEEKKSLYIARDASAEFDGVGIEFKLGTVQHYFSLKQFFDGLGITPGDCLAAFGEREPGPHEKWRQQIEGGQSDG